MKRIPVSQSFIDSVIYDYITDYDILTFRSGVRKTNQRNITVSVQCKSCFVTWIHFHMRRNFRWSRLTGHYTDS